MNHARLAVMGLVAMTLALLGVLTVQSVGAESLAFASASVAQVRHFRDRDHNVVDLRVTDAASGVHEAAFLAFFDRTGGLDRWGLPLSEVFEESPGVLTQYFQNGVIDFRPARGIERRLVWDYFGGGLGGSPDLGVEAGTTNTHAGRALGPWGHRVSNLAADGTPTEFLDAFERLGGVASFGLPKTEARVDTGVAGTLFLAGLPTGIVRQYFQAAVLEFWPGRERPVRLVPLGEMVREREYPNDSWVGVRAFRRVAPLAAGAGYDATLLRHAFVPQLTDGTNGILVGRGPHNYMLALHPQRHLFYTDGWYAVYYDGLNATAAYSRDGASFSNHTVVSHVPTALGITVHAAGGKVYLLYPDSDSQRIFIRVGTAEAGVLTLGDPIQIVELLPGDPFPGRVHSPSIAFETEGRAYVVFRKLEDRTSYGLYISIWITWALDPSLRSWAPPVRISTEDDAHAGGAGESGSLAFVGDTLVAVYSGAARFYSAVGDAANIAGLAHTDLDSYQGTHDYQIQSAGGRAHLIYLANRLGTPMMTYRIWDTATQWSGPTSIGRSATHQTALSADGTGNVWVFYGNSAAIWYRIKRMGSEAFEVPRCLAPIDAYANPGYLWLASAQPANGDTVGLLWVEKPSERFELRFKTVSAAAPTHDLQCGAAPPVE